MHEESIALDPTLIQGLIQTHLPEYSNLEISEIKSPGTENRIFRLGADMVCRFPYLKTSRPALEIEAEQFLMFKRNCSLLVPQPIEIVDESDSYPNCWSVYTYIDGEVPTIQSHEGSSITAQGLGKLILELRNFKPQKNVFEGLGRGGILQKHDEDFRFYCEQSTGLFDVEKTLSLWGHLKNLEAPAQLTMCHRDLQPQNLVLRDSIIVGVLDCGSYGASDPALDLVGVWHMFDSDRRNIVKQTVGVDEEEWMRGAAWALTQAVGLAKYYEVSNPEMSIMGINTINKIINSEEISC
jgi:aminoglycoside phosphotransferase (APT) family kinase protein